MDDPLPYVITPRLEPFRPNSPVSRGVKQIWNRGGWSVRVWKLGLVGPKSL